LRRRSALRVSLSVRISLRITTLVLVVSPWLSLRRVAHRSLIWPWTWSVALRTLVTLWTNRILRTAARSAAKVLIRSFVHRRIALVWHLVWTSLIAVVGWLALVGRRLSWLASRIVLV
jgi:hypothetical protein